MDGNREGRTPCPPVRAGLVPALRASFVAGKPRYYLWKQLPCAWSNSARSVLRIHPRRCLGCLTLPRAETLSPERINGSSYNVEVAKIPSSVHRNNANLSTAIKHNLWHPHLAKR
jgi:hypothetical protein